MTSSALTGNTSGLASATSPGLVGITTQTFAGDKTLTGLVTASGGIINTGLTGANATTVSTAGSGKIGEIQKAGGTGQTLASGSGVSNISTLSLTAGIWLLSGSLLALPSVAVGAAIWITNAGAASATQLTGYASSQAILSKRDNDSYVGGSVPMLYFNATSATSIYLNLNRGVVSSFSNMEWNFTAVRIA
jgi:hypothetical protein